MQLKVNNRAKKVDIGVRGAQELVKKLTKHTHTP
jgi:hypothetical protein